jgi:hypothetical protein
MPCVLGFQGFAQVQRDLMSVKIKIHPSVGTATLRATQHVAIKMASHVQIGDVEGEMKKAAHMLEHIRSLLNRSG